MILYSLIQTSVSCVNIVLFKAKVGANFKVFPCLRSFQNEFYVNEKLWISRFCFLNH